MRCLHRSTAHEYVLWRGVEAQPYKFSVEYAANSAEFTNSVMSVSIGVPDANPSYQCIPVDVVCLSPQNVK